jgi:hypothetical protein
MQITVPSFTISINSLILIFTLGIYLAASIWVVFWVMMRDGFSLLDTPNPENKKYFIIFFPGWIFWTIIFGLLSIVVLTYRKFIGKN